MEKERGVFGENGDAALAFEVVGVHDALDDGFIGTECAGLLEHGVDEGGFAVVDVGDDGDVANVLGHGACVIRLGGPASSWALACGPARKSTAKNGCATVAQTKIAAGATSSPDESPLVLRCGRASYSVTEMWIIAAISLNLLEKWANSALFIRR